MPQWAAGPGSGCSSPASTTTPSTGYHVKWQNFRSKSTPTCAARREVAHDQQVHTLTQQQTVRLDIPWPQAMQFNYIRVRDPKLSFAKRTTTFASPTFQINDIVQVAPAFTIELALQLDVWTRILLERYSCAPPMPGRGHLPGGRHVARRVAGG